MYFLLGGGTERVLILNIQENGQIHLYTVLIQVVSTVGIDPVSFTFSKLALVVVSPRNISWHNLLTVYCAYYNPARIVLVLREILCVTF
jgi:hypothetical protein